MPRKGKPVEGRKGRIQDRKGRSSSIHVSNMSKKGDPEKGRSRDRQQRSVSSEVSSQSNRECQEGFPLGARYSGRMNVTTSGRTCQVWAASQPHDSWYPELGEHNHCRNPDGDPAGVWCQTTDPEKEWESCSVPICEPTMLKVLDFSADNDQEPDSNGEFTSATLKAGFLPESFTICSAMMVDAWTTVFTSSDMFTLLDTDGDSWVYIDLFAARSYTEYQVNFGPVVFFKKTEAVFFPLQWARACLSLDSITSKVRVVVDGQLLGEVEYKMDEMDEYRPANISLRLGYSDYPAEFPIKIADLNVFSSSLSLERMVGLTRTGEEECGAPGDLVSWEEAEWTLHSQAKVIKVDREWEGPCRRESQVQIFTLEMLHWYDDCMTHCQKIAGPVVFDISQNLINKIFVLYFLKGRKALFVHSVCANFGLDTHSVCTNFSLNTHSVCTNFSLDTHSVCTNFT